MTAFSPLSTITALAAAALLLVACAGEPTTPVGEGKGLETGTALPPPAPGEPSREGDLSVTPVAPAPLPEGAGEQAPAGGEAVVIQGPDGTSWTVSAPRDEAAYQADVDDCYRYALGQTRRDAQIIDDRNAGIDTLTSASRYSGLRQRVDEYDLRNRRASLMSSCMEAKGYVRADTVLPRLEW